MFKDKVKDFLKDRYNQILISILIFAFVIRIRYLFIDQAVWWDAADYLTLAKIIGGKIAYYARYDFNSRRPFFLAVLWGILYRLGFGEVMLRLTEILFSFGIVILTYLLGKTLYNKKVGLIASFIVSGFYLMLFFTARLMTDIPAVFFLMLTMLMFWKGFVNNEGKKYMWLTGVFAGLAMLTRAASIYILPLFFVFIFIIKRFSILKNKHFWLAIVIGLIVFSPFLGFIYVKHGGNPIDKFLGLSSGRFSADAKRPTFEIFFKYVDYLPTYLDVNDRVSSILSQNAFLELGLMDIIKIPFLILFLFGLLYLIIELFLGYDMVLKNENKKLKSNLFIVLWFLIPLAGISLSAGFEPRYILAILPAAFIIISLMLIKLYKFISKYNKYIAIIVVSIILFSGVYSQASYGHNLVKGKQMSYYPVKQAGLWIKENSNPEDVIISQSLYQNMYYSERDTYGFYSNKTKTKMTEEEFDEFIIGLKPKYLVISVFEPGFTPEWAYTYGDRNPNLRPVQYYPTGGNPTLIIYEYVK